MDEPDQGNQVVQLEEVKITKFDEKWNKYELADGTTLEIKLVLLMVLKDEKVDEFGVSNYVVRSQNVVKARPVAGWKYEYKLHKK